MKKIPLILIVLLIVYLSNTPNLYVSQPESWFNEPKYEKVHSIGFLLDSDSPFYIPWSEIEHIEFILHKIGHVIAYSLLTFFVYININKRGSYFMTWFVVSVFAMTDEVHQYFIVGRSGRLMDVFFDSIISIVTIIVIFCVEIIIYMYKNKKVLNRNVKSKESP